MDAIVIVGDARTACGSFQGALSTKTAPELGAVVIDAALKRAKVAPESVSEVLFGHVLSAGVGQAPVRQASRKAGLPDSVGCTSINKLCGSGLKAVMLAHDSLLARDDGVIVAGGMESMSNAPYLLPGARQGLRMGHSKTVDHMFFDGLEDADTGRLMGSFAQDMADKKQLTRKAMDDFAISSLQRAQAAQTQNMFEAEIVPVSVSQRQGDAVIVSHDEQPQKADISKIPHLKPVFKKDGGTVTAANASSISDGAAALVLMRESQAKIQGLAIKARILGHASHAQHPSEFTIAPCGAISNLLKMLDWQVEDVDLWEINEAFAMVAMLPIVELGIDRDKVNIFGGACALGHPIGATGARLLVTPMSALRQTNGRRGIASLCIGGGEAVAMAIELPAV